MLVLSRIIMLTLYQRGDVLGVFLQPQHAVNRQGVYRPVDSRWLMDDTEFCELIEVSVARKEANNTN